MALDNRESVAYKTLLSLLSNFITVRRNTKKTNFIITENLNENYIYYKMSFLILFFIFK